MITLTHFLVLGAILFSLSIAGIFLNRKNTMQFSRKQLEIALQRNQYLKLNYVSKNMYLYIYYIELYVSYHRHLFV